MHSHMHTPHPFLRNLLTAPNNLPPQATQAALLINLYQVGNTHHTTHKHRAHTRVCT